MGVQLMVTVPVPAGLVPTRRYQVLPTDGSCFECPYQAAGDWRFATGLARRHQIQTGHRVKVVTSSMEIYEFAPGGDPLPPVPWPLEPGRHRRPAPRSRLRPIRARHHHYKGEN
jgi:hypothetical protein